MKMMKKFRNVGFRTNSLKFYGIGNVYDINALYHIVEN